MLHRIYNYLLKHQVIFALCIVFFVWFFIQIRTIVFSLFLSYIIMAALLPLVSFLRRKHVPKLLAVLIPYFGILLLILLLIFPLVPFVVQQIELLIIGFPQYLDRSASLIGVHLDPEQLEKYLNGQLSNISSGAIAVTTKVFGGIFTLITIFIVSLYLLLYNDIFKKNFSRLFHPKYQNKVLKTLGLVNEKLGAWLQGQLFLSFFIGLLTWVALTLIGLPFA